MDDNEYADRIMIVYDDAKQRYVSVTSDKRRWPFYEDALIHEAKLEEQRRYIRTVAKYTSTMPINIVRRPHLFLQHCKKLENARPVRLGAPPHFIPPRRFAT